MALTKTQQEAYDRIVTLRQLEQRTGVRYGAVEKRVFADLSRADILAIVDAFIAAGGAISGFDTTEAVTRG
jgi:hypothetical protein